MDAEKQEITEIEPEQTIRQTEYTDRELFNIKLTGKSYREMEVITGIPFETIYSRISKVLRLCDKKKSETWKKNRDVVLNNLECELAFDMGDEKKREKASLNNSAYAFERIFKARKLEAGEATSITGVIHVTSDELSALRRRSREAAEDMIEG